MLEKKEWNIAIVGATGAVGEKILSLLEEEQFPVKKIKLLSSKRSAGKKIVFQNQEVVVEEASPEKFQDIDIAFFSAGGSVSKQLVPEAVNIYAPPRACLFACAPLLSGTPQKRARVLEPDGKWRT